MTADPRWRLTDANGRPVHNGKLWAVGPDGTTAPNWLDHARTTRGQAVRRSRGDGYVCNGPGDSADRIFVLAPGDYVVRGATENGAPLFDLPVHVDADGHSIIEVRTAAAAPPAPASLTIRAGAGSSGAPADSVVHIAEAIRELIERSR